MSWRVPSQSRAVGQEWARIELYGADRSEPQSASEFAGTLARVAGDTRDEFETITTRLASMLNRQDEPTEHALILGAVQSTRRLAEAQHHLATRDADRPFRVVLMGQTMAGKSTLFEYLSGGDGSRIGNGGQRTSRDISERLSRDAAYEIVDTPGVGAMDGQDDFETAFDEAPDADLVIWVSADRATQQQTGIALQQLADLGKPLIVALNCMRDISDEQGLQDLLEFPEEIFGGDAMGNLRPIERHLDRAGGRILAAIPVHALAAVASRNPQLEPEQSHKLRESSRVDALVSEIRTQREETAAARRIAAMAEYLRVELLEAAGELDQTTMTARRALEVEAARSAQYESMARRELQDATTELQAAFGLELAGLERWVDRVDPASPIRAINAQWDAEVAELNRRISADVADISARLDDSLRSVALDIADDWETVDTSDFTDIGGRGAMWGNRIVKGGTRTAIGIGGIAAGAQLGALLGTFVTPGLGTAIGLAAGAVISLVGQFLIGSPLDRLSDRILPDAATFREKRRAALRSQLEARLRELDAQITKTTGLIETRWTGAVEEALEQRDSRDNHVREAVSLLQAEAQPLLERALTVVDTELARQLLQHLGRGRTADSLFRATRWRGAGLALELPDRDFEEMLLFPVADTVEVIVPTSKGSSPEACALQIMRNATGEHVIVEQYGEACTRLRIDPGLPSGIRAAWAEFARAHTGVPVEIGASEDGSPRD